MAQVPVPAQPGQIQAVLAPANPAPAAQVPVNPAQVNVPANPAPAAVANPAPANQAPRDVNMVSTYL